MKWEFIINWKDETRSAWLGESKGVEDLNRTIKAFMENLDGKARAVEIKVALYPAHAS